jgi:hypothetical protein
MATKRKTTKKKSAKAKRTQRNRAPLKRKGETLKKSTKKKPSLKAATKRKTTGKKKTTAKKASAPQNKLLRRVQSRSAITFPGEAPGWRSGEQSGDLQGLSNVEDADSESVDELLEEGNAFEAEVVSGVEDAGDRDEREVHTHEVPEDDVPGEYLDED